MLVRRGGRDHSPSTGALTRILQNADPALEKMLDRETNMRSIRGYFNVGILSLVIIVLVGLFAGW